MVLNAMKMELQVACPDFGLDEGQELVVLETRKPETMVEFGQQIVKLGVRLRSNSKDRKKLQ